MFCRLSPSVCFPVSSLLMHASLLLLLPSFLISGLQWSWAWKKWCCNVIRFSPNAVTYRMPPSRSFQRSPGGQDCNPNYDTAVSTRDLNSTTLRSLQSRLLPVFTFPTSPLQEQGPALPFLPLPPLALESSVLCRNLDCVCLAVLLFQQIPGWLKSHHENRCLSLRGSFHLL